jgi:hypothetical protein
MKGIFKHLCGGFLICALTSQVVWAQATAQINGSVKDQSGAVLPGVEITVTQTETGISRNAISSETGSYILPNLPVGPYRFEAALPGFRTYVQTGIVLQVNSSPAINAILEVGQVSEQVEVQANANLVETRSVGVGQVIENERILELPLNGRQATDLIVLAGAAVQVGTNNNRGMSFGVSISVAGSTGQGVAYNLDGALHSNPFNNLNLPLPFPDALQEFKVETSGLTAQNGWAAGGAVSAVTKSGTNDIHGDLFEFVRNDLFNARNYFATKNSTLKRNQFGGTIGGPIMQNKLFFFGGYQGTTIRQDPSDSQAFVPTAAMLAGDFTTIASPACRTTGQLTLRAPFVNNRIDPASFNKMALTIANKLPKTNDPCGQVTFGQRNIENDKQLVGKIDFQKTANHSLFGRYMATLVLNPVPYSLSNNNLLTSNAPGLDNLAQSFTLGDTYLLGPNMVNSFRLALNRTAVSRVGGSFFSFPELGAKTFSYLPHFGSMSVTSGFSFGGGTSSDATFRTTTYSINDDLNYVRGTHQIGLGVSLAYWRINFNANINSAGTYSFDGSNTGLGLADFLTGKTNNYTQGGPNVIYMSQAYSGLYGQDTWKVTPRFTLTYGLRWEPYFPQILRNGTVYAFDINRFRAGVKSSKYVNAPAGFYYPGDPGFPGTKCRASGVCQGSGLYKQWLNLEPRLGLAWDPEGNGHTSIRASYAFGYEFINGQFHSSTSQVSPWASEARITNPVGGIEDPFLNWPGGNQFPIPLADKNAPFASFGAFLTMPADYHLQTTSSNSWNLSVQRQVSSNWLASVSYLGTQKAHLWRPKATNPAIYFPGGPCTINGTTFNPCSTAANHGNRRPLYLENPREAQYIGILDQYDTGGTQSYHGMIASIQRRAVRGLSISGNYTWSHCVGDSGVNTTNFNPAQNYLDPNNRAFDRGDCLGDRRQLLNLTSVYQTPQFTQPTLRILASGWRLSGIYRTSAGAPLTVVTGVDRALDTVANQRPNQVLGNPYDDTSTGPLTRYLNPAAFAQPALGTYGNMSPLNIRGPRTWQFDTALSRMFKVREAQTLEFRAEAYNITNSFRPGNPNVTLNNSLFGQIRTSDDPRILQFALKYVF